MKHVDHCGMVYYDPKPETLKARAELDKILQHTRFNWRTKALWSYFRRTPATDAVRRARKNKARDLYIVNLSLNGALVKRLMIPAMCRYCAVLRCRDRLTSRQRLNRFRASIRPSTIANWQHAIDLIDIALEHKNGNPQKPKGI